MASFELHTWQSRDGLTLSARVYPGDRARVPVLCLPGLTRNARDFEDLAAALSPERAVICPDLRGRGNSQYAPDPASYAPPVYCDDILLLLESLGIARFVAIGTSLGGIITMILAGMLAGVDATRIAGAVLNDIGPEIDPAGLERIRGYVGVAALHADWDAAARALAAAQADVYPGLDQAGWLRLAHRWMRETRDGVVFDYDMAIAQPFADDRNAAPADTGGEAGRNPGMWPLFDALAGRPVAVVRGANSDILSAATATAMAVRHRGLDLVTLPGIGHAPTLDEPAARAAIHRLLDQVP